MTNMSSSTTRLVKKVFLYSIFLFILIVVLLILGAIIASRVADGPLGPIQGGAIRAGTLVNETYVDWESELGGVDGTEIEFHLESTQRSRTTGSIVHDGQLYIPCDLGFMWRRFSGGTKLILQTMYVLKTWHEDAMQDGNIVIRIGDNLYERRLVRVADPELLDDLRIISERQLNESYMGPIPDVPGDPAAIWYFRVDPR